MNQFEINNGFIGMKKYVIIKLIGIIAKRECKDFHNKMDDWDSNRIDYYCYKTWYLCPMKYIPARIRVIIGLCHETVNLRNNWLFDEAMELVNRFDLLCPYE
jgi:hypothetical protein